jgi:hypothetical protein
MDLLRKFWQAWKRLGQFLGDAVARVVLTVFYFTLFVPFGLGVTLLSDPLRMRRPSRQGLWLSRQTGDRSIEDAHRQF